MWQQHEKCLKPFVITSNTRQIEATSGKSQIAPQLRALHFSWQILLLFRSAITIFPPRRGSDISHDFRVWNSQLISYAGYTDPEHPGQIVGDPINVEFTQVSTMTIRSAVKESMKRFLGFPEENIALGCFISETLVKIHTHTYIAFTDQLSMSLSLSLLFVMEIQLCEKLGWKGKGSRWDILPLVLSANGQDPQLFQIPEELILRVKLKHPK